MFQRNARAYASGQMKTIRLWFLSLACSILLFSLLPPTPAHAELPPGIQEYYVLGYEFHHFRMITIAGTLTGLDPDEQYMASIVDVTATADNQIIFYDQWEDGYETDIFNPAVTDPVTGTLVLGDGDPGNGDAADFIVDYSAAERGVDKLRAGDSIPFSSRYGLTGASTVTGFIPVNPREASAFRFDGGDRIVSVGGPIGLVHAMWPVERNGASFTEHTYAGDSWEIYSTQALKEALVYKTPIGEDLPGLQFEQVDLQVQALQGHTTVTIDNGVNAPITFQLDRGQTYFGGLNNGYIDSAPDDSLPYGDLALQVRTGTSIVADNPIQAGIVAYDDGFQDRYYNMIPENLWDKYYIMPTGDNPEGTGTTAAGNSQIYIYNPNVFTITVTSADTAGENPPFEVPPTSVRSYQDATGAGNLRDTVPTLSGVSLSSDARFWAIHVADANPAGGTTYDWGNTFLPLFFLTDEYYASWAPGNVNLPPDDNGSPLWVTAVEDNTRINVDYDNDDIVDESFLLDSLQVVMLRDDADNDQSGAHIWTEDGQKIAVIWGEDAVGAGTTSPYLDIGHLMLPIAQEWIDPVYFFTKDAYPEVLPETGGEVLFSLKATASAFADVENLVLTDTLPMNWTYSGGSTVISYPNGSIGGFDPAISTVTSTIAGGQVATHTVLFWDLGANLFPEQSVELQFRAAVSNAEGHVGAYHYDGFESNTYTGGTGPWLDQWREEGETTNPAADRIEISGASNGVTPYRGSRQLRIEDDGRAIYREIDLTDFAQPTLRFKRHFFDLEDDETYGVEISVNGGISYTSLMTWSYPDVAQDIWMQEEVDLSPYITDTARIRFRGIGGVENGDEFLFLDEIEVYDSFILHTNQAAARGEYFDYGYIAQSRKNIYITPFKLAKRGNAKSIALGSTVVFTLTYSNSSDTITGTDFIINDTLPPGLLFAGASDGGVYITQTNTVSWTIGNILTSTHPLGSGAVVLTATVADTIRPEDGEPIENTANLINDEYFIRSNVVLMTALAPDLQVTKSAPGSAHPGDLITYTIQYANRGSIPATHAVITDAVPANTTYQPGSCTGCAFSDDTLVWDLGEVAPGESGALSFVVQIADAVPPGTNVQNVALIYHDALSELGQAAANTKVGVIKLDKTATPSIVGPGQTLTFTIGYGTITNTTAFVVDAIPAHTDYVPGSATRLGGVFTPTYSTNGVTYQDTEPTPASSITHLRWEVNMISGTVGSLAFQARVDDDLDNNVTIQNQASLSAAGISKLLSNPVSVPTVKLALDTLGPNIIEPGETFAYTLRLSNYGSGDATATLSDTLPADVAYINASPEPDSADPLNWTLTIPANTSNLQYTVVVSVTDSIPVGAELKNAVTLSSDQHTVADSFLTYITQEHVTIVPDNAGSAHQTGDLCYSHIVFNNGAVSDTVNLTASHSLWSVPNLTLYKDVNENGAYQPSTDTSLSDTNGDLIPDTGVIDADGFVHILACLTVPEDAEDGSANVTTVRATSVNDSNHLDEAADTTTVLVGPGLTVAKSQTAVNGAPLYPGDEITYTIRVTNLDTIAHTHLVITDAASPDFSLTPDSGAIEPGGEITVTASALTATYPTLGVGQTITVTLRARLSSSAGPGDVSNVVYADSDQQGVPASASASSVVQAGLSIEKTAEDLNGAPLYVDDLIRYVITVTNESTSTTMTHVTVTDTLPAGVAFVSASPSGYTGPDPLVWDAGDLLPGVAWSALITVQVDGSADPIGGNVATVSSDQQTELETEPVLPPGPGGGDVEEGGLFIHKSAEDLDGGLLEIGDLIRYTVVVTNDTAAPMTGVVVSDTLPAGVAFISADPAADAGPNPLVWNVGNLDAGLAWSALITVQVDGSADPIGGNVAAARSDQQPDPVHTDPVLPPAPGDGDVSGLFIHKSAEDLDGGLLEISDLIRYTVVVTNDTAAPMTGVVVSDTLPAGVAFISASPAADAGPNPLVWNIGALDAGLSWSALITVQVDGSADPIGGNVAAARSDQQPDPVHTDPVLPPEPGGEPGDGDVSGLFIHKTAEDLDGGLLEIGDLIRYTVVVTNDTAAPMTGVVVSDTLPVGVAFISADPAADAGPNPLVWSVGNLDADLAWSALITVQVDGSADPIGGNVAAARSDQQPDPVQTDPVLPPEPGDGDVSGLFIHKTAEDLDGGLLEIGDLVRYTVVVTNDTASQMTGVVVSDTLPAGVAFISASPAADAGPNPLVWNVGALDAGLTWSVLITVRVDGSVDPIGGNVAAARSDQQPDPVQTEPVLPPEPGGEPGDGDVTGLFIHKTAEDLDGGLLEIGDLIRYTVVVTNDTAAPMTGVVVSDTLPAGVAFISADPAADAGPNPLVWNVGALDAGLTWSVLITVRVDGSADPIGGNVAAARSDQQPDPVQTEPVLPPEPGDGDVSGLFILKTAEDLDGGLLEIGDLIRYTVAVTNDTAAPMTGVVVTDTLPAGVAFVSAAPAADAGPNPLVWNVGNLDAGLAWSVIITVQVDGSADPIGGNVAAARSDQQPDPVQTEPILPPEPNLPAVSVVPTTVAVEEGGATDVYMVRLATPPTASVEIAIVTDGQTAVNPTSLIFDATTWDTAQQVTVTAVDDDLVEGAHTSIISHTAASADSGYDGIAIPNVIANITDNDIAPAPVSVQFNSAAYRVKEIGGAATITVTLSGAATMPVTVTYTTSNGTATAGSDYTAVGGALRFDIGQTSRTFTVPVRGDAERENEETVNLTLSNPENATLGIPDTAILTIENNSLYLPIAAKNYRS